MKIKKNQYRKESDTDNIDNRSQIEGQIQNQTNKNSEWRFEEILSITLYFYETTEVNGSAYTKLPIRILAILNFEKDAEHFYLWSILAKLHPLENGHPNRAIK